MNPTKQIRKYYLGVGVLALFTIVVAAIVLTLAISGRQDAKTYRKANEIAQQLNQYIDQNQKIPDSLQEAGAKDVPSTITYTSDFNSYEFCVTYDKENKDAAAYGPEDILATDLAQLNQRLIGLALTSQFGDSYGDSYLILDAKHKKGKNCQTITPIIYDYGFGEDEDSSEPDSDTMCLFMEPGTEEYELYCGAETENTEQNLFNTDLSPSGI